MVVYLCGAMSKFYYNKEYDKATEWRKYVRLILKETNIKTFDPTDNSEIHFTYPTDLHDGVIQQNYTYLKKCDIVLVNLDMFEDSIGSIWEVITSYNENKAIIAFGKCELWEQRPHFKSMFRIRLNTVEDACEYILSMYRQKI